jgi:hypothetical protein
MLQCRLRRDDWPRRTNDASKNGPKQQT